MKILIFMLCLLAVSCGKAVDVQIPPTIDVTVGPDYEKAALFCDKRYGYKTQKSEECFQDYRSFFSIKTSVDDSSIAIFCSSQYSEPAQVQACKDNLSS